MNTETKSTSRPITTRVRDPLLRRHFVYRALAADGRLLFVGCTNDLPGRMRAHAKANGGWHSQMARLKVAGPYNYDTARQLEREAIESGRPLFDHATEFGLIRAARDRLMQYELLMYGKPTYADVADAALAVDAVMGNDPFEAPFADVAGLRR